MGTNANGSQQKRNDKVWKEFLDVLTGKRPSQECPTLEELDTKTLSQKQLKAARQALQHYQAIDEILFEGGLPQHAKEIEGAWKSLVALVVNATQHNPELGSTLLPSLGTPNKKVSNGTKWCQKCHEWIDCQACQPRCGPDCGIDPSPN